MRLFICEKPSLAGTVASFLGKPKKEDGYYLASCTVDDEGNYVFYLEPGEYTMKVYNSNVIMDEDEEASVTNDAVVKDLDITNAN